MLDDAKESFSECCCSWKLPAPPASPVRSDAKDVPEAKDAPEHNSFCAEANDEVEHNSLGAEGNDAPGHCSERGVRLGGIDHEDGDWSPGRGHLKASPIAIAVGPVTDGKSF